MGAVAHVRRGAADRRWPADLVQPTCAGQQAFCLDWPDQLPALPLALAAAVVRPHLGRRSAPLDHPGGLGAAERAAGLAHLQAAGETHPLWPLEPPLDHRQPVPGHECRGWLGLCHLCQQRFRPALSRNRARHDGQRRQTRRDRRLARWRVHTGLQATGECIQASLHREQTPSGLPLGRFARGFALPGIQGIAGQRRLHLWPGRTRRRDLPTPAGRQGATTAVPKSERKHHRSDPAGQTRCRALVCPVAPPPLHVERPGHDRGRAEESRCAAHHPARRRALLEKGSAPDPAGRMEKRPGARPPAAAPEERPRPEAAGHHGRDARARQKAGH
ncbi:hypothetical protein Y695_01582 [Hydrogenophaga sp. T4]|nr:hypothetical protein Y695_01582 [Hydrogenophaga sp. T4]